MTAYGRLVARHRFPLLSGKRQIGLPTPDIQFENRRGVGEGRLSTAGTCERACRLMCALAFTYALTECLA